jgi:stringent starvation protein B
MATPPTPPSSPESQGTSTRPYLIRALHDWCTDNGFTPYVAVFVDASVQVPMEYVKNQEIVLNVGFEATSGLRLGNEAIEFKARFGGVAREIMVPIDHVIAIYARENGQGMAFPVPNDAASGGAGATTPIGQAPGLRLATTPMDEGPTGDSTDPDAPGPVSPGGGRPSLKRIK